MQVTKMDDKGRVQIPGKIRKGLKLAPRESVGIEMLDDGVFIRKIGGKSAKFDRLLHDLEHPGHSKVRVTRKMLESLEKENWLS